MFALTLTLLLHATPQVGQVAPDFTVVDVDGKKQQLSELVKTQTVVLAFFPKAFTSGCTQELTTFTEQEAALYKVGAKVIAVSTDDAETLRKFRASLHSHDTFVADPEKVLVSLYDVKMPLLPVAKRTTFVIGEGRKVLRVDEGSQAVESTRAVGSCPQRKAPDAGH